MNRHVEADHVEGGFVVLVLLRARDFRRSRHLESDCVRRDRRNYVSERAQVFREYERVSRVPTMIGVDRKQVWREINAQSDL